MGDDTQPQSDAVAAANDKKDSSKNPGARDGATAAAAATVKRKNRGNLRKRPAAESDEEGGSGGGEAVRRAQKPREAPLAFTTKREGGAEPFKFESSGTIQVRSDGGATRALETETEFDRDNRAIREKQLETTAAAAAGEGAGAGGPEGGDAVYRGMTGYADYRAGFRREGTVGAQKAAGSHGPLRASAHVRMSIRVDYQPDICKDYKETGYCGFGDSCKFLHDRGDYKSGWEIDREWEEKQKAQRERLQAGVDAAGSGSEKESDSDDDELPFACFICRRPWAECQDPVVTRCKHYFCEQCALQHNAKSKKCFVCEQPTGGIFNPANDIIKREKGRKLSGK